MISSPVFEGKGLFSKMTTSATSLSDVYTKNLEFDKYSYQKQLICYVKYKSSNLPQSPNTNILRLRHVDWSY